MIVPESLSAVMLRSRDAGYSEAAAVYSRTGTPEYIVRAISAQEVAAAIRFAAANDLSLAVRSGGHSGQGWSTNDGGLVIDLRSLAAVEVLDRDTGRVRLGGGATWGDVAEALRPHGLAVTSGDTRSVGVGGIATSGGIGWMVRTHGLMLDSILSAEVVTPDGEIREASPQSHADLFWAIRGGGGNFGVVTSIECRAQHVGQVFAGYVSYQPEDLREFLGSWAAVHRVAAEELNSTLYLMRGLAYGSGITGALAFIGGDEGDDGDAERAIEPFLKLDGFQGADFSWKPYADVLGDSSQQPGTRPASTNTLVTSFDDGVAAAFASWYAEGPGPKLGFVRWLAGAFGRVPSDSTAFSQRDAEALVVGRVFGDESASDAEMTAMLASFDPLHDLGAGSYQGFLGVTAPEDLGRIYPPATLQRLRQVKRRYDPDNVLRLNYNIAP